MILLSFVFLDRTMNRLIKTLSFGSVEKNRLSYIPRTLLYYKTGGNSLFKRYNKLNLMINKSNFSGEYSARYNHLRSVELSKQFILMLDNQERSVLKEQLLEYERVSNKSTDIVAKPTWEQLSMVCLQCGLPFVGFGFVDNFLMIVAGEMIESWIGVMIPISTMAGMNTDFF
jgi:hypothetical protein